MLWETAQPTHTAVKFSYVIWFGATEHGLVIWAAVDQIDEIVETGEKLDGA